MTLPTLFKYDIIIREPRGVAVWLNVINVSSIVSADTVGFLVHSCLNTVVPCVVPCVVPSVVPSVWFPGPRHMADSASGRDSSKKVPEGAAEAPGQQRGYRL